MTSDASSSIGDPASFSSRHVAHLANDLRILLAVIGGGLASIRHSVPARPETDRRFAEIEAAVEGAFLIGHELAVLARGHVQRDGVADLNQLVARAQGAIGGIVGSKIRVSLDLAGAAPLVRAEAVLVEWILLNLVANAADGMPDGGVLTIETAMVDRDSPAANASAPAAAHARLTVKDTGHGVTAETRPRRALQPFFGTRGLGLTSAAISVRRLGGSIRLADSEPRGTRVDVYLPADSDAGGRRR